MACLVSCGARRSLPHLSFEINFHDASTVPLETKFPGIKISEKKFDIFLFYSVEIFDGGSITARDSFLWRTLSKA